MQEFIHGDEMEQVCGGFVRIRNIEAIRFCKIKIVIRNSEIENDV